MFLDGSFCNDWIFLLPSRNATETQDADHCITTCLKLWAGYYILIIDHHWELIEVSEEWWQLVTAVHNEGNSLNAFWVTFVVLWLHSFLSCLLWFCLIWQNDYVQKKCYNILLLNIFTAWNHTYGKGLFWGSQMAVVTQKTSEVVSALAQRQDVLEIELQELQQVLLAMQVNTFFLIISLFFFHSNLPFYLLHRNWTVYHKGAVFWSCSYLRYYFSLQI